MGKIEKKLFRIGIRFLLAGLLAVVAVSAAALLLLRKTSADAGKEMATQAAAQCEEALTAAMQEQTLKYTEAFQDSIENRLLRSVSMMDLTGAEIEELYEHPESYGASPFEHAGEIEGEGKQMHWLLPADMALEGEIRDELYRLGNMEALFSRFARQNARVLRIYFTSQSGINIGYDADYREKPSTFEGRESNWYKEAEKEGGTVVSEVYRDSFLKIPVLTFSRACHLKDGTFLGVLAIDLEIRDIESMVEEARLEFDGYAMLLSEDGAMVAAKGLSKADRTDARLFLGEGSKELLEGMETEESGTKDAKIGGKEKYLCYSKVGTSGLRVLVALDKDSIKETAEDRLSGLAKTAARSQKKMSMQMLAVCVLWAAVIAVVVGIFFVRVKEAARQISEPIIRLSEKVGKIGHGDFTYVQDIGTNDEIEDLSVAFEKAARSLKQYVRDISVLTADRERIAAELDVASAIQSSMLPCIFPPFPEREEVDIYALMRPAKEVGGDFYDFFMMGDKTLAVVMADVSGKGVPAAMFMVIAKTLIKDNLLAGRPLPEAFERVNDQLCENNTEGMFVTVFAAQIHLETGEMAYVNAGHNPPVIRDAAGNLIWLASPSGFVIAGMEGMRYEEGRARIGEGDLLFAYTDGVTEAMNPEGELYGEERLSLCLKELRRDVGNAEEGVRALNADMEQFSREAEQADDITILAFRLKNPARKITLRADINELDSMREFLERILTKAKCPEEEKQGLLLAAEEIFANVAEYAYEETGIVTVSCGTEDGVAHICFMDEGKPYDPLGRQLPDLALPLDEREIGGLGIYLARTLTDKMEYRYKEGKNILEMWKRWTMQ